MTPRAALFLTTAAAVVLFAQPSGAFDLAEGVSRDVSADVVAAGSAYNAVTGGACTGVPLTGGTCTLTVTNRGTTTIAYTIQIESNPDSVVESYQITGSGSTTGDPLTSEPLAPGSATTLTATLRACAACAGQTYIPLWTLTGATEGDLDTRQTRVPMHVTYAS